MTTDTRYKDFVWIIPSEANPSFEGAQLAVLMDIRDELQRLNELLHSPNFVGIPPMLDRGLHASNRPFDALQYAPSAMRRVAPSVEHADIPPMPDEIVTNTRPKRRTAATKRRKVKK